MTWKLLFENPARRDLSEHEARLLCTAIKLTVGRAHSRRDDLFRKLGTTYHGRKIPEGFSTQADIEGVHFTVFPSEAFALRAQGKRSRGTTAGMRAYVNCPVCLKEVSIGRMAQHAEVHVSRPFIGECIRESKWWER